MALWPDIILPINTCFNTASSSASALEGGMYGGGTMLYTVF